MSLIRQSGRLPSLDHICCQCIYGAIYDPHDRVQSAKRDCGRIPDRTRRCRRRIRTSLARPEDTVVALSVVAVADLARWSMALALIASLIPQVGA